MGKVLLFNLPAHGHINPTLPLVEELRRRGESVLFCTGEKERQKVESAGAAFYPLPYDLSEFSKSPKSPKVDFLLFDCAIKCLPELIQMARREKPDYILTDFVCIWGKIVAEQLRIPAITLFPNPVPRLESLPPPIVFTLIDTLLPLGRRAKRMSAELASSYQRPRKSLIEMLTSDHGGLAIIQTSEIFQVKRETLGSSYRFTGPSIPVLTNLPSFPMDRIEGKQTIYISLGTIYGRNKRFFQRCIAAFRDSEYMVVISTGNALRAADFPDIPSNVIICEFVPQDEILKRSSLFITHGGMNSIHAAIYHGVPMLVAPQGIGTDQLPNARAVEAHGAGVCFNRLFFSPRTLLETSLQVINDPSIKNRIKTLSDTFRASHGAVCAVDEILKFIHPSGVVPQWTDS